MLCFSGQQMTLNILLVPMKEELHQLLDEFQDVFQVPKGLP